MRNDTRPTLPWLAFSVPLPKRFVLALMLPAWLGIMNSPAWGDPQEAEASAQANSLFDTTGQEFYAKAKPYWDDPKVIREMPALSGLKPADSQDQLIPILDKVGEQLGLMLQKIPDLTSHEVVRQNKSGPDPLMPYTSIAPRLPLIREYSYLILAHRTGGAVKLEEYRTELPGKRPEPASQQKGYPLTSNFALAWSRFYRSNRSESRFRFLGEQKIDRRNAFVVAFAQKPGFVRDPSKILIEGRATRVLEQGIAWIDESDYHIRRLRIDMLAPRPDIHVQALVTEIRFGQVQIQQLNLLIWLPQEVKVFMGCDGAAFQNVHRYSDYRLFTVKTRILPAAPSPATPSPDR
jgi:hypothetical protein